MTRKDFLSRLRRGLEGLSPDHIHDVMSDYEAHFVEGVASGRTEEEIAAALGDPARLARELKAEAGFRRWEEDRTAGNLAAAVLALLGLAAVDVMFLLPFLFVLGGVFLGLFESIGPSLFLDGLHIPAPYQLKDAIAFTMLVFILIFRPTGILGERLASKKA